MKALLFWVVAMVATLVGCGGAPQSARTALTVAAAGVAGADVASASVYEHKAAACLEEQPTSIGYRACVSKVDDLEAVLRTAHGSLLATQAGLDAWDAGDEGGTFLAAAPCLAQTLSELLSVLTDAGVDLPDPLAESVGLLGAFGGSCQ